jgi:hypothetical protein
LLKILRQLRKHHRRHYQCLQLQEAQPLLKKQLHLFLLRPNHQHLPHLKLQAIHRRHTLLNLHLVVKQLYFLNLLRHLECHRLMQSHRRLNLCRHLLLQDYFHPYLLCRYHRRRNHHSNL